MIYTKNNPKLVNNVFDFRGMKIFTGVVKDQNNNIVYYVNGKFHKIDGPALEYGNNDKYWYLNNKIHREDGPAIEAINGDKFWYLNGKAHRTDGPAVEWHNGSKQWWLNGEHYGYDDDFTNESWIRFVKLELLK